jgi:hypothetical protein
MATKKSILDDGKVLLKSKTFWFGVLIVVNAIATIFGFKDFQPSENLEKFVELGVGLIVILLRLKTSQPITKIK